MSSDDEEELEDLEAEDVVLASASKATKDDDFDVRWGTILAFFIYSNLHFST